MRLLSLEVTDYRNIAAQSWTPGRELTVICGNNGQGKTNLLEAIWLLTGGKSFRGGKGRRAGAPGRTSLLTSVTQGARIAGRPDEPNHPPDRGRPGTRAPAGRHVERRATQAGGRLAGSFPAVVFDPGHLSLVKGGPEGRRKFPGRRALPALPRYLAPYAGMCGLQQKNALLTALPRHERPYAEKRAFAGGAEHEALAAAGRGHQQRRRGIWTPLAPPAAPTMGAFPRGAERLKSNAACGPVRAAGWPQRCGSGRPKSCGPGSLRPPPRGPGNFAGRPARPGVWQPGTAAQRACWQPENGGSRSGGEITWASTRCCCWMMC